MYENNISFIQYAMEKGLTLQEQLLAHYGYNPIYIDKPKKQQTINRRSLDEINTFKEQLLNAIHPGNVQQIIAEFLRYNYVHTPLDRQNNSL